LLSGGYLELMKCQIRGRLVRLVELEFSIYLVSSS